MLTQNLVTSNHFSEAEFCTEASISSISVIMPSLNVPAFLVQQIPGKGLKGLLQYYKGRKSPGGIGLILLVLNTCIWLSKFRFHVQISDLAYQA